MVDGETVVETGEVIPPSEHEEFLRQFEAVRMQLAEARRQAFHWHQRCIRAEEVIEQQKNELTAVLKANRDFHDSVVEYMLALRADQLTIANAIKSLTRPRMSLPSWIGVTAVAIAVIAFLYFNPEMVASALEWLSVTRNQIFALAALAAIGGITYYLRRRR